MHEPRHTHFVTSFHASPDTCEKVRHAALIARLSRPRYASAIEVGCAIGALSAALRLRCDRFLGLDLAPTALQLARRRLAHCRNVALRQVSVPERWPRRQADLIVLCDVLHQLDADELNALAHHVHGSLLPGGEVVIAASLAPMSAMRADAGMANTAAPARAFCKALRSLRPFHATTHRPAGAYLHRTLLCRG